MQLLWSRHRWVLAQQHWSGPPLGPAHNLGFAWTGPCTQWPRNCNAARTKQTIQRPRCSVHMAAGTLRVWSGTPNLLLSAGLGFRSIASKKKKKKKVTCVGCLVFDVRLYFPLRIWKVRWSSSWLVSRFGLAVEAVKQKDLGSKLLRLSFLFKRCGLWTLSCDFVPHNYKTLKWLSSLPILMQCGGDSVAIDI